jgi:anti-anti-sigma regulatory factor
MALSYILKDFGTSFATRDRGRELREDLLSRTSDRHAVLDLAGVTNLSYSFADEFMGKLRADGFDLLIVNMAPAVERSVQRAVGRRTGAPA